MPFPTRFRLPPFLRIFRTNHRTTVTWAAAPHRPPPPPHTRCSHTKQGKRSVCASLHRKVHGFLRRPHTLHDTQNNTKLPCFLLSPAWTARKRKIIYTRCYSQIHGVTVGNYSGVSWFLSSCRQSQVRERIGAWVSSVIPKARGRKRGGGSCMRYWVLGTESSHAI